MEHIRIFLSSPGDVEKERELVPNIIDRLNNSLGEKLGFHLKLMDWKTHVAPDMGRPQEIINQQIGKYDLYVGILWKRFGTPTGKAESGTEEEFNIALQNWEQFQKPRILFYFSKEKFEVDEVDIDQLAKVKQFKKRFSKIGLACEYESGKFAENLYDHLANVLVEKFATKEQKQNISNFKPYVDWLQRSTQKIYIRGLATGESKAHAFDIHQIYIPLKTNMQAHLPHKGAKPKPYGHFAEGYSKDMLLEEALQTKQLVVVGDPGAGKTTFARWLANMLCKYWHGAENTPAAIKALWPNKTPLPILVPVGRFAQFVARNGNKNNLPIHDDSTEWLFLYMEYEGRENAWQIPKQAFKEECKNGNCLIVLDGLDEAPDAAMQDRVCSLARKLHENYHNNTIVITTRPAALELRDVPVFQQASVNQLDRKNMEKFLALWTQSLYKEYPEKAKEQLRELLGALQARPEINKMARTPVMLTALAVVHYNEKRLPEQRADLYESIIVWLLRSREKKPGKLSTTLCRQLLQKLATAMFLYPGGRRRNLSLREAADALKMGFANENNPIEAAECFLRDEMVDSGIIVKRGHSLEFWHLSFQEYLAAYEIAGMADQDMKNCLFGQHHQEKPQTARVYASEWREVCLLLAGILYKQGKPRADFLVNAILDKQCLDSSNENLPNLAGAFSLIHGIIRDLGPYQYQPEKTLQYQNLSQKVKTIYNKNKYREVPAKLRVKVADALGSAGYSPLVEGEFVSLPAGSFWMGAQNKNKNKPNYNKEAFEEDSPVHEVWVDAFKISKYPVTVGQYKLFVDQGGYANQKWWQAGGFGKYQAPDDWEGQQEYPSRPMLGVSWYEAMAYAKYRGGNLPTEAQWEYAARGTIGEYRKYPWGNKKPDSNRMNYDATGLNHASPIGIFPENISPEGVSDMAGNVWEWCRDGFRDKYYAECHAKGKAENPEGPGSGNSRVVRGGSWVNYAGFCAVSYRVYYAAARRNYGIGFRLALSL